MSANGPWSALSPTATQNVVLAQETALRGWLVWRTCPTGEVVRMAPGEPLPAPAPTAVHALGVTHDTESNCETPPPRGRSQLAAPPVPVRKATYPSYVTAAQ